MNFLCVHNPTGLKTLCGTPKIAPNKKYYNHWDLVGSQQFDALLSKKTLNKFKQILIDTVKISEYITAGYLHLPVDHYISSPL